MELEHHCRSRAAPAAVRELVRWPDWIAMRHTAPVILVLCGFLGGCSNFTRGRGDVGLFIVQQAAVRTGLSVSTHELPAIDCRWRYSEDEYGVVIRMPRETYPAIESLLRQAFGEPTLGPEETYDGGKIGVYRLTTKGGAIQYVLEANRTQVIVIRPLSQEEFAETIVEALQDRKVRKALAESFEAQADQAVETNTPSGGQW